MALGARAAIATLVALLAASGVDCSSGPSPSSLANAVGSGRLPQAGGPDVGTVSLAITLPGAVTIDVVDWTITAPGGPSDMSGGPADMSGGSATASGSSAQTILSDSVDVSHSASIQFQIGDIPAGAGYDLALSAISADATVACVGTAPFDITARTTTNVSVQLQCRASAPDAGSLAVTAVVTNCATVTGISVSPTETALRTSVDVSASATGPDPTALTYAWSASSGIFDNAAAAETKFTCTAVGPVTLTIAVTDTPQLDFNPCDPALDVESTVIECSPPPDNGIKAPTIVEYPLTPQTPPGCVFNCGEIQPFYVATGPDGALWFTAELQGQIGRMTIAGVESLYDIPPHVSGSETVFSNPVGLTGDNQGHVWVTDFGFNRLCRISTIASGCTFFSLPPSGSGGADPEGIAFGPDGNLWIVEEAAAAIARMTPTGQVDVFRLPSGFALPDWIVSGPDQNLWFTERAGFAGLDQPRIGRITTSGVITEFDFPTPGAAPMAIAAGPDGNLWFTEEDAHVSRIGKITPTGVMTEFLLGSTSNGTPLAPQGIAGGPDGNVWFTESTSGRVGRITPDGDIAEFDLASFSTPVGITLGPDGRLWYADSERGILGAISP